MADLTLQQLQQAYDAALEQIAAESFLQQGMSLVAFQDALQAGNNPLGSGANVADLPGKLRMTEQQAQSFVQRYVILDAQPDDATGFSAVALRDTATPGRVIIAVRSTEIKLDKPRDVATDWQILLSGFAFDQVRSMQDFVSRVQPQILPGTKIDLVGYSLSGNVVRTIAAMFPDRIDQNFGSNVVFNATGLGNFRDPSGQNRSRDIVLQAMMTDFRNVEDNPASATNVPDELLSLQAQAEMASLLDRADPNGNVYANARSKFAEAYVSAKYSTTYSLSGTTAAEPTFAQYFGHAMSGLLDTEATANGGVHPPAIAIPIEGQPLVEPSDFLAPLHDYLNTHSLTLITDSLRLQILFKTIDPTVSTDTINNIYQASSATAANTVLQTAEGDTLEKALDAIRKALLPVDPAFQATPSLNTPSSFGNLTNRQAFYVNIASVEAVLPQPQSPYRIETLVNRPLEEVKDSALLEDAEGKGLAYRYALKELNPFAIIGPAYAQHNFAGELNLFNLATGAGTFTTEYIQDRGLFLETKLSLNQSNMDLPLTPFGVPSYITHYQDNATGYDIPSGASVLPPFQREYIFGADIAETIQGNFLSNDHLYGGDGVDTLLGNGGDDYLQGDDGNDTLDGGSGADRMLGGRGDDTYIVDNVGDSVTEGLNNGSDTVKSSVSFSFSTGDNLEDLTLTGTSDINGTGNELDNLITGNDGVNWLDGKGGTDHLIGGLGNDILAGGTENDLLEGGAGFDTYLYNAGDGNDQIEDSDAQGMVIFNGRLLTGGIKQAEGSSQVWKTADGQFEYRLQGTDLKVTEVATGIELTINENFQSGQMGITLMDEPDIPSYDNGRPEMVVSNVYYTQLENDHNYIYTAIGESTIATRGGNDQIYGYNSTNFGNFISGGNGHDRIYGGAGNDGILGDSYFLLQVEDPEAEGDDFVDGLGGDDEIEGDGGNDRLYGGDGIDRLFGDAGTYGSYVSPPGGDDFLDGGAGDDFLWGDYGADILIGGAGNDRLAGDYIVHSGKGFPSPPPFVFDTTRAKDDFLDGGDGADLLYGDGGNDTLVGGVGNDQLYGDYGEGAFLAADGDLINIPGNDVLDGGAGDDFLYGMGGDDVIGGGEGIDVIYGDFDTRIWLTANVFGNDVIDAGAGDDFASGGSGNDTLFGGTGNDFLWGDISFLYSTTAVGDDSLDGGAGDDILFGGRGNDRLEGGDGHDILIGTDHYGWNVADQDVLAGGAGDDRLYGQGGDDVLSGGEGTDILFGDDYYFADQLPGPNVIRPGLLLQNLVSSTAPGDDVLDGGAGDDFLAGGAGNDILFGGSGNDFLYGDSGQSGVAGDDRLIGGLGNDYLDGGGGNDIYEFNVGDGIDDVSDSGQGNDTVLFGSGISASSVTLTPDSGRIFLKVGVGPDGILLGGVGDVFGSQTIEQFQFADGTTLTYADLIARGFDISGTGNDDVLIGTDLTNRLTGGLGNDTLWGGLSEDTFFFNSGDGIDLIVDSSTPEGMNTVVFGPGITSAMLTLSVADDLDSGQANVLVVRPGNGADAIQFKNFDRNNVFGPHAVDSFQFADGSRLSYQQLLSRGFDLVGTASSDSILGTNITDRITAGAGDDLVRSGAGDDLLDGGAGDDQLRGESGNDTYLFGSGSGHDRILDEQGTADVVRLAPGILSTDVAVTRSGDDLLLSLDQGADQLTIAHYFLLPTFRIEEIQFSDGAVLTSASLDSPVIQGTEQSDVLQGTDGDDVLVGLGGNDQITGLAGNDVLDGGAGADVLTGGTGNDTYIIGESGDVAVEGSNEGVDTIQSSITYTLGSNLENLALTGSVAINGTGNTFDNVLTGNSAANVLSGGAGNDTYVVGAGDTVVELAGEGTDMVQTGVNTTLGANVENLTLTGSASLIGTGNELDNVLQADGSISVLAGGDGNDTYLIGPNGDDDILVEAATGGIDTVIAAHDYRLPANIENLTLQDVGVPDFSNYSMPFNLLQEDPPSPYSGQYMVGIGNDLDNVLTGGRANDRLDGGLGVDTMMGGVGHDVYIVDNSADVVVERAGEGVDTVEASVDYVLSVNVENLTLTGTGAINGTGNAMSNIILGNDAANVLDGGAGNDILNGEEGADTFLFGLGSGQDVVGDTTQTGAVDTVQVTDDLTPSDLAVFQRGEDLVLHISGTTDELALANFYGPSEWGFKQVRFADGTVWSADELRTRAMVVGGTGPDTIQNPADYTLPAIFENIFLADNFTNVGPYADNATGNELDNLIVGNTRDNILDGGAGNDVLVGGLFRSFEGGIFITGTGSDILIGGAGDDILMTDGGNITFAATSGGGSRFREIVPREADDLFIGGIGNDTYILYSQQETVTEFANEGTDTVRSTVDYILGDNVENLTLLENLVVSLPGPRFGTGNELDNVLIGNSEDNVLRGGNGNDTLWGGSGIYRDSEAIRSGSDLLIGGAGNDTYLFKVGDGIDTIEDTAIVGAGNRIQFDVGISQSDLTFTQDQVARTLIIRVGSSGADTLLLANFDPTGTNGSLVVETLAFADGSTVSLASLLGLGGPVATNGDDTITTGAGNDVVDALGGNDIVDTGAGNDTITGGTGNDQLTGGTGDDTYIFNAGDGVDTITDTAAPGEGNTVEFGTGISSTDLTLGLGSLLIRVGTNGDAIHLTPFDQNDAVGTHAIETFRFADGTTLSYSQLVARGFDLTGTAGTDAITGTNVVDRISGLAGNDTVQSGAGDDVLDGGAGADTLIGGQGNDTYVVDNVGDVVTEQLNEGTDTVQSSVTYTLGVNIENLTLTGTSALDGTGNELTNVLIGNEAANVLAGGDGTDTLIGNGGNDILNGGLGADILNGGDGDDLLYVDAADTSVNGGAGFDVVNVVGPSGVTLDVAAASIEVAIGSDGNDTFYGAGAITALSLDGGAGMDVLTGGSGNDVLAGGEGNDTLTGNEGNDVLNGGAGADVLNGGAGDDLLYIDADDTSINGGLGHDAVSVLPGSAGVTLDVAAASIEDAMGGDGNDTFDGTTATVNLLLQGNGGNDTLLGGAGTDALNGGSGNDLLNGGVGADILVGGTGDDTYVVDDPGDQVTENLNEGTDTVQSAITYTLGTNVENLTLTGTAAINGTGNGLDNVLTGNSAANILTGGAGNDTYAVSTGDTVVEAANQGLDTVVSDVAWTLGANLENLTLTGTGAINGTGNTLNNVLTGNSGNNTLNGGAGADQMAGGAGNDTYVVDNAGDVVTELANEGIDLVQSSLSYSLGANVENVTLTGTAAITATGNSLNNVLTGNSGANVLTGGAGDDTYVVGAGDTVIEQLNEGTDTVQSAITWTLGANVENLTLTGATAINGTGNSLNNVLTGNSAANVLDGGAGDDQLTGGAGADTLLGGSGNDLYIVDNVGDVVTEQLNEGLDTVQSSVSYTLGANVEQLTLTGTGAINATGNSLNNVLTGNSGANVLDGGTGADTLVGGAGNDTYVVDHAGDVVTENANEGTDTVQASVNYTLVANLENLTLTGTAAITGTGNAANNVLTGNSGNNVLDGGGGTDTLRGGLGDDTYVIDDATDVVTENLNEGIDTVQTALTATLGANVENLVLTGIAVVNGTGNTLNNVITGNSAANTLNGGTGADSLIGGQGDDTYIVENVGDVVTEQLNEGLDTVQSSVSYTLSANVENLTLTGTGAITATGNSLTNLLTGNAGANVLDGGTGADTLVGGAGNDTYVVDDLGDVVTELLNQGTDTVQSAVSYTLGSDLENLTLTGTAALSGTGNSLNNVLTGNSAANVLAGGDGNDTLDGGAGADSLLGGLGNDTYLVDNGSDVVTEQLNEGTDTVQSSVTYTLAANVENLTLTGSALLNGTGNALANVLTGNSAANILTGGAGNDTYVVSTGDTVVEQVNEGTDTVQSDVSWTLGANLENLTLTGTAAIAGSGNTLANTLRGNSAANILTGGAGNDTYVVSTGDTVVEQVNEGTDTVQSDVSWTLGANLENLTLTGTAAIKAAGNGLANVLTGNGAANQLAGGTGNDTLRGGLGNDTYLVNRGEGQDLIAENDATVGNADTLLYGATINPLDLVLSRQANDLRLAIHGSTDYVTVQNWYSAPTTAQVETIQAGNGQALLSTQVDQLIQAMAGFTTQTGLTWDQAIDQRPQDVQTVLAASWQ